MSVAPSLAAFSLASFLALSIPVDVATWPCIWPTNWQLATEASSASAIFAASAESIVAQLASSAIRVMDAATSSVFILVAPPKREGCGRILFLVRFVRHTTHHFGDLLPQFEHRIRVGSFASVTGFPAIRAGASGSTCRAAHAAHPYQELTEGVVEPLDVRQDARAW